MSTFSSFEDAIKTAVTPGPERLLPGVALGAARILKKDETSEVQDYLAAFGTMQLDPSSPPVSTKTVMWMASCTKLVTAVAAMQCVERGLFALDDPTDIERLLPEWTNPNILSGWSEGNDAKPILRPAKEKITLRRLLTHTSGIGYDFLAPDLMKWRKMRGEGVLTMQVPNVEAFTTPLLFEPGSGFAYGGGVDLAGIMVARANKTTLEAYMRENIFDKLSMHDTSFYVKHTGMIDKLMPMTSRTVPDGPLFDGYPPGTVEAQLEPVDEFGGAGLFSTAEDYLKLLKSLLRRPGQLLKPDTMDELFNPCITTSAQQSLRETLLVPLLAHIMIPGELPLGSPGAGTWSYAPGGIVALEDSKNGLKAGTVRWGGAPNLKWWVDRASGTCGIFATQLCPAGEEKHAFLGKMFGEAVTTLEF